MSYNKNEDRILHRKNYCVMILNLENLFLFCQIVVLLSEIF